MNQLSLGFKSIDYGRWRSLQGYGAFAAKRDAPLFVQFSGGRTSAFMAAMAPDECVIAFENTGREDERTLEFVRDVGEAIGREIVWLEFRPPPRMGDAPKRFGWCRVDFGTAARKGEPFVEFMRAVNAYRKECGNDTIAPWVRSRICTVHLKHRVLDHYIRSLGIHAHDRWVGLRADEPHRVAGLRKQQTLDKGLFAPLYEANVTKEMVMEFWARQSFDLGLPEHRGNCDGCFLKDQGDISRALGGRPDDVEWWAQMEELYPRFGGETFYGYRALAAEYPARMSIEDALRSFVEPANDSGMDQRRFHLLVVQERKRLQFGPNQSSCACEASMDPEEEEDAA